MNNLTGDALLQSYVPRIRDAQTTQEKLIVGRSFITDAEMLVRYAMASDDADQWRLAGELQQHVEDMQELVRIWGQEG